MKIQFALSTLLIAALLAGAARAQTPDAANPLAGRWMVSADFYGTSRYYSLQLEEKGDTLSGTFLGAKVRL